MLPVLALILVLSTCACVLGFLAGRWSSRGEVPAGSGPRNSPDGQTLFDHELRRCYAEWQRLERPFSLLVIGFHTTAGAVAESSADSAPVRRLVQAIGNAVREVDWVSQTTPWAVTVLLPRTGGQEADLVAARVEDILALRAAWAADKSHRSVYGIGLATIRPEDSATALVLRTEKAARFALEQSTGCARSANGHDVAPAVCASGPAGVEPVCH